MGGTRDRAPGVLDEEGIDLEDASDAAAEGQMRYTGSRFSLYDSAGEYDPRSGGGGISAAQHNAIRQLIHFIDNGPADGFTSGAYSESTYSGALPTSEIWYDDDTKANKIVELSTTYSGVFPATETWKLYDTDGTTVLVTAVDTIVNSGAFEANRTRTWS
jgi:hypothetical protein